MPEMYVETESFVSFRGENNWFFVHLHFSANYTRRRIITTKKKSRDNVVFIIILGCRLSVNVNTRCSLGVNISGCVKCIFSFLIVIFARYVISLSKRAWIDNELATTFQLTSVNYRKKKKLKNPKGKSSFSISLSKLRLNLILCISSILQWRSFFLLNTGSRQKHCSYIIH